MAAASQALVPAGQRWFQAPPAEQANPLTVIDARESYRSEMGELIQSADRIWLKIQFDTFNVLSGFPPFREGVFGRKVQALNLVFGNTYITPEHFEALSPPLFPDVEQVVIEGGVLTFAEDRIDDILLQTFPKAGRAGIRLLSPLNEMQALTKIAATIKAKDASHEESNALVQSEPLTYVVALEKKQTRADVMRNIDILKSSKAVALKASRANIMSYQNSGQNVQTIEIDFEGKETDLGDLLRILESFPNVTHVTPKNTIINTTALELAQLSIPKKGGKRVHIDSHQFRIQSTSIEASILALRLAKATVDTFELDGNTYKINGDEVSLVPTANPRAEVTELKDNEG